MSKDLRILWVYLETSPLLWLTVTLVAYQVANWIFERLGRKPIINPVLVATIIISVALLETGTDYRTYFNGAQFVHFLLGPAVVALAVPLYTHMSTLRRTWPAVLIALTAGAVTAAVSAVATAWAMGAPMSVVLSMAPKSATSPIAMGISERIGGTPSLTAVLVILTGVVGAVTGGWVLDLMRIRSPQARGLALGTASHGIGTTAAMQMSEVAGAYSGLAMGLNGAVTAIIVPLIIPVLVKWLG